MNEFVVFTATDPVPAEAVEVNVNTGVFFGLVE